MESFFDQSPLFLYSETQLPPAGITQCGIELRWFANDTEQRYKQKPHPTLKPEDVHYRFNSKGYRCAEFENPPPDALKVVSIGASEVFGVGLPDSQTFPQLLCDRLAHHYGCGVVNWNLGVSGGSADYISRILYSALPVLQPDIVLIVFPPLLRREYVNDTDRLFIFTDRIGSYNPVRKLVHWFYDPENSNQNAAHRSLSSDHADQINFFKNYQLCEALCVKHDVMWLYSPFSQLQFQHAKHLLNSEQLVEPGLLDLRNQGIENSEGADRCFARDLGHPGVEPNRRTAEMYFDRLQALYSSRLSARLSGMRAASD